MAVKSRSRNEKIGSGLGLVFGIIGFMVPLLFEKKEGFDVTQMILAMVSAVLCSELGARVGKWLDRREQS